LASEFRRNIEECKLRFFQKSAQHLLQTNRAADECELAVKRHRAEAEQCRTKAEQVRLEMEIHRAEMERRRRDKFDKLDTMLTRQTLKDRRVPKAEIDAVLPLPTVDLDEN